MNQLKGWLFFPIFFMALGCAKTRKPVNDAIGDFSLGTDARSSQSLPLVTTSPSLDRQLSRASLPISFKVGKGRDSFPAIPKAALPPANAVNATILGNRCQIGLMTNELEVNRFIPVDGKWIEFQEALAPKQTVKLDLGMDLAFNFSSQISVYVTKASLRFCQQRLAGKRTYLGKVSLQNTQAALLAAPGSPLRSLLRQVQQAPQPAFLRWNANQTSPVLEDQNGLPLTLNSPMFFSKMPQPGFY